MAVKLVVSQHAEESSFHWLLRRAAVAAPHYNLRDLADLDTRVDAHVDGLRIAGEEGWNACTTALPWEEPGDVFVGTLLALESGNAARVEEMLAIATTSAELAKGAVSALGWLHTVPRELLDGLLESDQPMARMIGVAAMAVRRESPGHRLLEWMADEECDVRARAFKASAELGRTDLAIACRAGLADEDEDCRFWATWAAAMLGDEQAPFALTEFVTPENSRRAERACILVARRLPPTRALAWHNSMTAKDDVLRYAVIAAGAIGDPVLIPWLAQMLAVDPVARPAGEAFSMITGADLAYEDLERNQPETFEAGPTENPEDEDVEPDPDVDLPWPDPQSIARWWGQNSGRFLEGTRYLAGAPISPESAVHVLRTGMQRQRLAAALELSFMRPGNPMFEARARGDLQRRMLGV